MQRESGSSLAVKKRLGIECGLKGVRPDICVLCYIQFFIIS